MADTSDPSFDPQQQEAVEVIMREMYAAGLQATVNNFQSANKKILEGGVAGSKAWLEFRKLMDGVDDSSKAGSKSLTGYSGALLAIPKAILGPLGVAAAFYEVGKALVSFSGQQVAIRNMATDAGYATNEFRQLTNVLLLSGNNIDQSREKLVAWGVSMNNLRLKKQGADIFKMGANYPGGAQLVTDIMNAVRNGMSYGDAMSIPAQRYNYHEKNLADAKTRDDKDAADFARRAMLGIESITKMSATDLSTYEQHKKQAAAVRQISPEEEAKQRETLEKWEALRQNFFNRVESIETDMINKIVGIADGVMAAVKSVKEFFGKSETPETPSDVPAKRNENSVGSLDWFKQIYAGGFLDAKQPSMEDDLLKQQKNQILGDVLGILKRMDEGTMGTVTPPSYPGSTDFGAPGTAPYAVPSPFPTTANGGVTSPIISSPPVASVPSSAPPAIFAPSPSFTSTFGPTDSKGSSGSSRVPMMQGLKKLFTGRADGGPVSAGGSYLVGERGPELMVPGGSSYYDRAKYGVTNLINNYKPPRVGATNLLPLPGWSIAALGSMKADASSGHHTRSFLRDKLGLDDPGEQASWQTGEAARERLDQSFAAVSRKNKRAAGMITADVDFSEMSSGSDAPDHGVFIPVNITTAPKAAKAAIDYNKYSYQ